MPANGAETEGHPDDTGVGACVDAASDAATRRYHHFFCRADFGTMPATTTKYIVNSGISTYAPCFHFYEDFPAYMKTVKLNIPESGNGLPDLLNETLWNIRWMLTMQDPNDGGVYHKLTNAVFDKMEMPDKATTHHVMWFQKSTAELRWIFCRGNGAVGKNIRKIS